MNKILPYFSLFFLGIYSIYLIASPKIQLNIIAPTTSIINITDENDKPIELIKTTTATNNKLLITNVNKKNNKSKGNEIFFTPIVTEHKGQILKDNSYTIISGDWKIKGDLQNGGRWYSTKTKSVISFEGYTSNLEINFIKHPYSGIVNINWNNQDMGNFDLYSEKETWQNIKLESPKSVFYSLISSKIKEIRFDPNKNLNIDNVQTIFGNKVLFEKNNINSDILYINKHSKLLIIFTIVKSIFIFITKILFLNIIYFIVGLQFIIFLKKLSSLQKITISIITGLALILIINTTLCYFLPVKFSMIIFSIIIIGIYFWNIVKNNLFELIKKEVKFIKIDKNFIFLLITAVISIVIVFFPAIIEPGWFFGHSYTDSFEYTNLSQIFINTSPRNYGFWLEVLRFAETIFLSINSILLKTTTLGIYSISAGVFWFQLPFLTYLIFKKIILNNTSLILLGVLVFSFSANLYSLFSQSYLAQYFLIFSLIYTILVTIILLDSYKEKEKKENQSILIISAILFTLPLILYPYHFFIPISLFLTGLFYLIFKKNINLLKKIFTLGIMVLILLNINSVQIINFSKTSIFNERLDSIGRYVVFPFYKNTISFGSKVFGVNDLIQNSLNISKINNELYGSKNNLNYIFNKYLYLIEKIMFLISIFFSILGIICSFSNKNSKRLFLFFTSFIYIFICFYLFKSDKVYLFGKLGLTLGPILIINTILGIDFIANIFKKNKSINFITNIFLCLFIFLNILTIFVDNSLFYLNRNSYLLYELRTHISTINIDLKKFDNFINSKKIEPNSNFLIIGNYDDIYKTDKDRILNNRILQILTKYKVKYSDNLNTHIYYGYDFGYNELLDTNNQKNNYILVFNGYKTNKIINCELVFETNIFKLYKNN